MDTAKLTSKSFVVGVDVGTGSARAALVDAKNGEVIKRATHPIKTWNPKPSYYQQSSENIWTAVINVVNNVVQDVGPDVINGIGFDATCSLVVLGENGTPVSVSPNHEPEQNIILWMDHRADKEAELINATKHSILNNVGGQVSLEMEIPKLLWLKKNEKEKCYDKALLFLDLPDFLTWKATGNDSRSLCSVVCKWLYDASPDRIHWNKEFMKQIGLGDLVEANCNKIGNTVKMPGETIEPGLSLSAAASFGLNPGTPVATSIIDAHAGALGLLGCRYKGKSTQSITSRLSLICGTSTCHMALSSSKLQVPGVWGPYYSAVIPQLWLNEAGQSATGKLIDDLIQSFPIDLPENIHPTKYLNSLLDEMADAQGVPVDVLTKDLHVWPDFHGNRSPIADPTIRGMISGLSMNTGEEQLALLYLATLQALGYGTRHIMEVIENEGHSFEEILVCGGLSSNEMFVQTQSNSVGKAVLVPVSSTGGDQVMVGSAILAATAAQLYPSVLDAVNEMGSAAEKVEPQLHLKRYHDKKYKVFKSMIEHQLVYRKIMNEP